jgi:hypothetical protein
MTEDLAVGPNATSTGAAIGPDYTQGDLATEAVGRGSGPAHRAGAVHHIHHDRGGQRLQYGNTNITVENSVVLSTDADGLNFNGNATTPP